MKKILLAGVFVGVLATSAQQQTQQIPSSSSTPPVPQVKDPQQGRKEQTTQIVTNGAKGTAPRNYNGSGSVDDDLRQRVTVMLSTGSVGTQGILASDQTTDIKVTVTNRVVTLQGDVADDKSKQTISKRVAKLDGVKGVNNNLTVSGARKPHSDLFKPDGYAPGSKDQRDSSGHKVKQ